MWRGILFFPLSGCLIGWQGEAEICTTICAEVADTCGMMSSASCLDGCITDATLGADLVAAETCYAEAGCHPGAIATCARTTGPTEPHLVVSARDSAPCGFSAVKNSRFSEYDCNPVFIDTDEPAARVLHSAAIWSESVMGHPQFHALYSASRKADATPRIGYAHSLDGTGFIPWEANPVIDKDMLWSNTFVDFIQVSRHAETGTLWSSWRGWDTQSGQYGVGIASSGNATEWEPDPGPAFDLREVHGDISPCYPTELTERANDMIALVSATHDADTCGLYETGGDPWSLTGPLSMGEVTGYDAGGVMSSALVIRSDAQYLFYVGIGAWNETGAPNATHLALATSSDDGATWKKSRENPYTGVANESDGYVVEVHATSVGDEIHVWTRDWYPDHDGYGYGWFIYEPHRVVH